MHTTLDHSTMPDSQEPAILIIDDNPMNLGVIAGYLEEFGFEVLVAQTGETGLEKAQFAHPDLILLDVVLPGIDGFETCRRLKENKITTNIPVIFMTVLTDTAHKLKGFQAGAVDYITKPFQKEEVLARVTTHLRLRELTERLEQNVQERTRELTRAKQRLEQEIAERKQAEEALRESEERYRSLIHKIQAAVVVHSADTTIVISNPTAQELLGLTEEQMLGKAAIDPAWKFFRDDGTVMPLEEYPVNQVLDTQQPLRDFIAGIYRPDKKDIVWVLVNADPVFDDTDQLHQVIVTFMDITENKRAEELIRTQGDLGLALSAATSLDEGLRLCLEAALHISGMDCGGVYLFDETFSALELAFHQGLPSGFVRSTSHYNADSANAQLVMAGKPIYTRHQELGLPLDEVKRHEQLRAIAVIPLHHEDRVIGCLNIASHILDEVPGFARVALETIATQIGSVIAHLQAEEALQKSEERYRQLFELESDAIVLIENETGRILEANSAASALYGYSHEELLTKTNTDLSAEPEDTQRVTQTTPPISDQVVTIPLRFHRKQDGTIFPVEITGRFFIRHGRPVHIAAIRDITARKRAEMTLQENERFLQGVFDAIRDGLSVLDLDLNIIRVNQWMEKMYAGHKPLIGRKCYQVYQQRSSQCPWCPSIFTIETGKTHTEIVPYPSAEKPSGWIELTAFPLKNAAGHVVNVIEYVKDITERKRAEEQIKNQNLSLEQAVQEKQQEMEALFEKMLRQEKLATIGQMAGSIAHELRNPLGAVKQSAFFLKLLSQKQQLDASNPKVQEHLELIEAELNTSEQVISDLLQMTRMKPPQSDQMDLRVIIEDAVEHCTLPEQIHFTVDLKPEPFLIWADPAQLRQVLLNLLTNAVQAIEQEGTITIRATQLTEEASCVIEIEDNGCGIESDTLSKIFEPLYTTKVTGTGLGLSICKQIIDHHQGQISVKSQPGQGTTVTIVLPNNYKDFT